MIPDGDEEYVPASEMIRRLLADNQRIAERQRAAIAVCDSYNDTPTGNILQDVLDQTERRTLAASPRRWSGRGQRSRTI
jgi:starvation-inducible DNA-binding protein